MPYLFLIYEIVLLLSVEVLSVIFTASFTLLIWLCHAMAHKPNIVRMLIRNLQCALKIRIFR